MEVASLDKEGSGGEEGNRLVLVVRSAWMRLLFMACRLCQNLDFKASLWNCVMGARWEHVC